MKNSIVPDIIKFLLVFVGLPRFVILFLAADGFPLPAEWSIVHIASGVFGACMAGVEGFAIAYIFGALVSARGRQFNLLVALTALTCAALVGSLTPSIYARVMGLPVADVIGQTWALIWSFAVALMTFPAAAAVGIAQAVYAGDAQWRVVASNASAERDRLRAEVAQLRVDVAQQDIQMRSLAAQVAQASAESTTPMSYACVSCDRTFTSQQALAAHIRHAHRNGHNDLRQAQRDVADVA